MNLEKTLLTIIFIGVCLALLTPFIVAPVLYPYSFDKAIFFQIIIELLLPIWIVLILIKPSYRPHLNFLTVSILIFFGVLFLSALFGVDFSKSFWGYEERMTGIFTLLHFLGFYFILSSLFKKENYKKNILLFALGVSFFISIVAVLEIGDYYHHLSLKDLIGIRVVSLLGNSIVFAGYLLLHIFTALYLAVLYKNKLARATFLTLAIFEMIALYFSSTRGAFIGFIAGFITILLILGVFYFFQNRKHTAVFIGLILCLIFISMFIGSFYAENILSFLKIESAGTMKTRLMLWDIAKEGFRDYPILGWGPENFDLVYDTYYNPQFLNHSYYETWSDRAHNLPLEILANTGILGLISYLLIFIAIFWSIFKSKNKYRNAILAGVFVAYFAQNLFAFDSPCVLLIFFLLMAYVSSVREINQQKIQNYQNNNFFIASLFIVSVVGIIFLNIRPAIASNYALKSIDGGVNEEYFKKSTSIWSPYRDLARIKFANAVYTLSQKQSAVFAIDEIKKSALNHPKDFSYPFTLGNLYTSIGNYSSAYEEYQRALELSPKRQVVYFQYASAKFLAGEDEDARDILRQAVGLDEGVGESHWRCGLGLIGTDNEKAVEEAKKALSNTFSTYDIKEINVFASIYINDEDWEGLVLFYEFLVQFIDESSGVWAQLASAYLETGQKGKACEAALRAAEIDPNFEEEVGVFIKLLENK